MSDKAKTFVVHLQHQNDKGNFEETWESSEEVQYAWGVGPSGDLMVFRAEYNPMFAVKVSDNDTKYYCYAPGTWVNVEVRD